MKQLTNPSFPSDEVIIRLFHSSNPDDYRLAAIFTIKKYVYKEAINEFLEIASRDYLIKKKWDRFEDKQTTMENKIYIYADKGAFVQIIVGSYGLWCKSLLTPPLYQRQTVIEYI